MKICIRCAVSGLLIGAFVMMCWLAPPEKPPSPYHSTAGHNHLSHSEFGP